MAHHEAALPVSGHAVGVGRSLLVDGDTLAWLPFHAPAGVYVAEEQVAAVFPPDWPLGRPARAAEAAGKLLRLLLAADYSLHRVSQYLYRHSPSPGLVRTVVAL